MSIKAIPPDALIYLIGALCLFGIALADVVTSTEILYLLVNAAAETILQVTQ